ncbi:MAG: hypothetical protein WC889_11650 [Myxococcota bacterium]
MLLLELPPVELLVVVSPLWEELALVRVLPVELLGLLLVLPVSLLPAGAQGVSARRMRHRTGALLQPRPLWFVESCAIT